MNQKEKSAGKFQSTLPRGERQNEETPTPGNTSISIHAPTRGATLTMILMITIKLYIFQSTLPRGERQMCPWIFLYHELNFNPRSHEGSDAPVCQAVRGIPISIHAPTRGATSRNRKNSLRSSISIHAPTRGATVKVEMVTYFDEFQSTLPRGERPRHSHNAGAGRNFNPRSHEGSDSNFRQKVLFSLSKNCLKYLILTTNYFN